MKVKQKSKACSQGRRKKKGRKDDKIRHTGKMEEASLPLLDGFMIVLQRLKIEISM